MSSAHDASAFAAAEPAIVIAAMVLGALLMSVGLILWRISTNRSVPSQALLLGPPSPERLLPAQTSNLGSVERLGRVFDRSRRLIVAEELVARELAKAPVEEWMIERYVLVDSHRIPFVIVGPGG